MKRKKNPGLGKVIVAALLATATGIGVAKYVEGRKGKKKGGKDKKLSPPSASPFVEVLGNEAGLALMEKSHAEMSALVDQDGSPVAIVMYCDNDGGRGALRELSSAVAATKEPLRAYTVSSQALRKMAEVSGFGSAQDIQALADELDNWCSSGELIVLGARRVEDRVEFIDGEDEILSGIYIGDDRKSAAKRLAEWLSGASQNWGSLSRLTFDPWIVATEDPTEISMMVGEVLIVPTPTGTQTDYETNMTPSVASIVRVAEGGDQDGEVFFIQALAPGMTIFTLIDPHGDQRHMLVRVEA